MIRVYHEGASCTTTVTAKVDAREEREGCCGESDGIFYGFAEAVAIDGLGVRHDPWTCGGGNKIHRAYRVFIDAVTE